MAWMIRQLIRIKALDPFRLLGHFTVAIAGPPPQNCGLLIYDFRFVAENKRVT